MSSNEINSFEITKKGLNTRKMSSTANISRLSNFNYSPELHKKKYNHSHIKKSSTFQEDIQLIERSLSNDHSKSMANDISIIVENTNNSRKKVMS